MEIGGTYRIGEKDNEFPNVCFDIDYDGIKASSDEMRSLQGRGAIIDWTGKNTSEIFRLRSIIDRLHDPSQKEDIIKELQEYKDNLNNIQRILIKEKAPGLAEVMQEYRDLAGILRNYLLLVREYVFEEVRMKSYPTLPSRQKCLWIITNNGNINEAIKYWWNELGRKGKLLRLEINGDLFQSDEQYLRLTLKPIDSLKAQAENYWRGDLGSDPKYFECLFIGDAKVLEVMRKDYAEFEAKEIEG